ncbi:hypothetical protein LQW54_004214 [Pestalotiopsis sp. IQ-011]
MDRIIREVGPSLRSGSDTPAYTKNVLIAAYLFKACIYLDAQEYEEVEDLLRKFDPEIHPIEGMSDPQIVNFYEIKAEMLLNRGDFVRSERYYWKAHDTAQETMSETMPIRTIKEKIKEVKASIENLALDRQAHPSWASLCSTCDETGCKAALILDLAAIDAEDSAITRDSHGPYFLFNHSSDRRCKCIDFNRLGLSPEHLATTVRLAKHIADLFEEMYPEDFGKNSRVLHYTCIWDKVLLDIINPSGRPAKESALEFDSPEDLLAAGSKLFVYLWQSVKVQSGRERSDSGTRDITPEQYSNIVKANPVHPEELTYLDKWLQKLDEYIDGSQDGEQLVKKLNEVVKKTFRRTVKQWHRPPIDIKDRPPFRPGGSKLS